MKTRQRGFTLIELMVTVSIVGILAAIVTPAYSSFVVRARVSEALAITGPCKVAVTEVYQTGRINAGVLPNGWGCNEGALRPSEYVHVVNTDAAGSITVTMSPSDLRLGGARGQDIVLSPVGGNLNSLASIGFDGWVCTPGTTMPPEYLPSSCRP